MAVINASLSFYVTPGYVADGYVEGEPIVLQSSTSTTGALTLGSGAVVSSTTSSVGTGQRTFGLDLINYSWDDTSRYKHDWDNWWLTDQTWEQRGIIFRNKANVTASGAPSQLGSASLEFTSSVGTTGATSLAGNISLNSLLTNSVTGGILFDASGSITGQASVVALGGFLQSTNATVNITGAVTTNGITTLTGNVSLTGLVEVETNGAGNFIGNVTIPATTTVRSSSELIVVGNTNIDLGSVVVVIGSATPVADPFRTATVDSETRKFPVLQETRSTTIQSETRVIIVPTETRNFTVDSETRTFKIPIPPFVSTNIRKK